MLTKQAQEYVQRQQDGEGQLRRPCMVGRPVRATCRLQVASTVLVDKNLWMDEAGGSPSRGTLPADIWYRSRPV